MILMGDEVRRTQHGNNNNYCHNDETNWFDWTLVEKQADLHRFFMLLAERRLLRDVEHEHERLSLTQMIEEAKKAWHGVKLYQPDWGDSSHTLSFSVELKGQKINFQFILNAYWEPLDFELLPIDDGSGNPWRRWIDTALDSPHDIVPWQMAQSIPGYSYRAEPRSIVVLLADLASGARASL